MWGLILTIPVTVLLLPFLLQQTLTGWLNAHGLSFYGFLLIIPWFGIVHPVLEQAHWAPLRRRTPLAHPLFAGYHLLVLHELLNLPGLLLCFAVLCTTSVFWTKIPSPAAVRTHQIADTGLAAAALILILLTER